jgi:hypothetical protein
MPGFKRKVKIFIKFIMFIKMTLADRLLPVKFSNDRRVVAWLQGTGMDRFGQKQHFHRKNGVKVDKL